MAAGARAGIGKAVSRAVSEGFDTLVVVSRGFFVVSRGSVVVGSFRIRGGIWGGRLNKLNGRERWNIILWYLISQKSQADDINSSALPALPP